MVAQVILDFKYFTDLKRISNFKYKRKFLMEQHKMPLINASTYKNWQTSQLCHVLSAIFLCS